MGETRVYDLDDTLELALSLRGAEWFPFNPAWRPDPDEHEQDLVSIAWAAAVWLREQGWQWRESWTNLQGVFIDVPDQHHARHLSPRARSIMTMDATLLAAKAAKEAQWRDALGHGTTP